MTGLLRSSCRVVQLLDVEGGTELRWQGELGTDLWALGEWWGGRVALAWMKAVRESLHAIGAEAERRAHTLQRYDEQY